MSILSGIRIYVMAGEYTVVTRVKNAVWLGFCIFWAIRIYGMAGKSIEEQITMDYLSTSECRQKYG